MKYDAEALINAPACVQLHNQMQMLCAGHETRHAFMGAAMLLDDLKADIRKNWTESREQRAMAAAAAMAVRQ